jgi:ribosomal protein L29
MKDSQHETGSGSGGSHCSHNFMTTYQMIGAIEETNRTWQPLSLPVRNEIAKRLDELDRENARLRMELDASCNAEELRQVRAENARLRDALNEARQYVEAYVLNVDAPGGVTGGESLLTKIDDILANAKDHRCSPEASDTTQKGK